MAKKAKKNVKPTNETSEKANNIEIEKSEEVLTEVKTKKTKADKTKAKEDNKNKNTAKKKAKNTKPKRNFFKEIFSELKKVNWLRGTTVSVYGMAKAGMLVIQFGKKKIIFVSSQATSIDSFSNCELLQLFGTILEYNTDLIKDDTLDFWYEIKD